MATLNKTDGIPLYVQIRKSLLEDIQGGNLKTGDRLPSEDELAGRYGVSRMTVRQGISDLIDMGVLYRKHGVGTFVAQPHLVRDHSSLTSFLETAEADGLNFAYKLLIADILPAKLRVAQSLSLAEGELVIRVKTLRFTDSVPVTYHDAYVPYKRYPQILQEDLEERELWQILETYGQRVKRAVQRLEAREADDEVANLLNLEIGAPILYKERTIYLEDGTPVEFAYCYNRGDRYSLTVVLNR